MIACIPTPALGINGLKLIMKKLIVLCAFYSNARFGHKWIETQIIRHPSPNSPCIPTPALGINGLKPSFWNVSGSVPLNSNARFGHKWIETKRNVFDW